MPTIPNPPLIPASNRYAALFASLRSGAWLTRERVDGYAKIFLGVEILTFIFMVLGTHGLIVPLAKPTTTDFVSFYAAGALADAGAPQLAYDRAAHYLAEERSIHAVGFDYNYFFYPPVFLLICRVLAHLPYLFSFVLFEMASGVAYLAVARLIVGRKGVLLPFLAFPPTLWTIGLGQNALLTAALFGAALYCLERRPALAGIFFGCLCYKPHLALLVPVALLAGRHWRCFFSAAATVALLVAASLLVDGQACWKAFFDVTVLAQGTFENGGVPPSGLVTPFAALRVLGLSKTVAYAGQVLFSVAASIAVVLVWWRRDSLAVRGATLAAATLLAVPVLLFYDWMLAAIAMAWLVRAAGRDGYRAWEKAGMILIGLGPVFSRGVALTFHIPFMPLLALLLLGLSLARRRRRRALSAA